MLLAYLLLIVGVVWLVQMLVKDRLEFTFPKVRWQPTSGKKERPTQLSLTNPSFEEESILGQSRTVFSQPAIPITSSPTESQPTDEHELLESAELSDNNNSFTEFTQFPDGEHDTSEDFSDYPANENGTEDEDDADLTNGENIITLSTFSDQIDGYPDEESQTQPNEFMVPMEESQVGESAIEIESLDELLDEETATTDVPLDKYFNQLQTVESILDDIRKRVRRKQSRQSVEELCTQFTAVLGYYGMINDKNVVTRLNNALKPEQTSDYAGLFMQVQRESMGMEDDDEEEVIEETGADVTEEVTDAVPIY